MGMLVGRWIADHAAIPDGEHAGEPFSLTDGQRRFVEEHYRLRGDAVADRSRPSAAFVYFRGSQLVEPVKWGKSPLGAALVCAEAVGPVLFDGWASELTVLECPCGCGVTYTIPEGGALGRPWPTPLIQVAGTSEANTDNVWRVLMPMIALGPLSSTIPDVGETRINLPGGGRIEPVTSAHRSRLGQRVTFALQEETHAWFRADGGHKMADTQRRNLAGTGGRFVELTNAWDPAEQSVAQITHETKAPGVYRQMTDGGPGSINNAKDRKRIIAKLYDGSEWVDQGRVEAEMIELADRDPAQAERFFFNRIRAAEQHAFDIERWNELADPEHTVPQGARIVVGVDGARWDDALAVIATEVGTGFQWPLGIWEVPESAPEGYEHPDDEVDDALYEAFQRFDVWRVYVDPSRIEHLVDRWQGRWGDRIVSWWMNRPRPVAWACRAYREAMSAGDVTHNGDPVFGRHVAQAVRRKLSVFDDEHRQMWSIGKDRPGSPRKMDAAAAGVISWEARGDCIATGDTGPAVDRRLRIG